MANVNNACAHGKWEFVSMWEVMGDTMIRKQCTACHYSLDGVILKDEWEESPVYQLSKTK